MAVPEFALNPLAQHLLRLFEGVNFKDFVAVLSAFSGSASATEKIKFIFKVYDKNGDGKVTRDEVLSILRDLSGSFLTDEQRQEAVERAFEEAGYAEDSVLMYGDFVKILTGVKFKMAVDVPLD
eukprot:TRINITY_DN430_c0_g1_i1.p1 TRINITY_DN430_c0_g1~~TRINITY_DN430_c0_g1_i1.p1  ORF type:complete len:124 (+),score=33.98 TRINITY_DN430_c0_g1_i1:172-543(+)